MFRTPSLGYVRPSCVDTEENLKKTCKKWRKRKGEWKAIKWQGCQRRSYVFICPLSLPTHRLYLAIAHLAPTVALVNTHTHTHFILSFECHEHINMNAIPHYQYHHYMYQMRLVHRTTGGFSSSILRGRRDIKTSKNIIG